jgi:hypothetical protein
MARALSCGGPDCDDGNAAAKPGQLDWFETPRTGGSYDYNCNNMEDPEFPTATRCGALNLTQCTQQVQGFLGTVPPCGQPGLWGTCRKDSLGLLCENNVITVDKIARCH